MNSMTNEEILEKQVEALEKLLQLRAAIIEELEAKVNKLEAEKLALNPQIPGVNVPWITTPWISPPIQQPWNPLLPGQSGTVIISNTCPDGSPHQYGPWGSGAGNNHCTKCGQHSGTITGVSTSGYMAPVSTTGLVQVADPNDSNAYGCASNSANVFTLQNAAK